MSMIGNQPSYGDYVLLDTIVPDGGSTYTLQKNSSTQTKYRAEQLLVSVNGSLQAAGSSFTVNGSTITFSENLTIADSVDFVLALGAAHNTITAQDASITASKLASDLALTTTPVRINTNEINSNITIGANQNAFVAGPITVNAEIVVNGTFTVV